MDSKPHSSGMKPNNRNRHRMGEETSISASHESTLKKELLEKPACGHSHASFHTLFWKYLWTRAWGKTTWENVCFVDLEEFSRFLTTLSAVKAPFFSTSGTWLTKNCCRCYVSREANKRELEYIKPCKTVPKEKDRRCLTLWCDHHSLQCFSICWCFQCPSQV